MEDALVTDGIDRQTAALLATYGVMLFGVALDGWLDHDDGLPDGQHQHVKGGESRAACPLLPCAQGYPILGQSIDWECG